MHTKSHKCTCGAASKKTTKSGKKPMNEFMKQMHDARKANKKQFTYKGKTYKQSTTKTGMKIYKSA